MPNLTFQRHYKDMDGLPHLLSYNITVPQTVKYFTENYEGDQRPILYDADPIDGDDARIKRIYFAKQSDYDRAQQKYNQKFSPKKFVDLDNVSIVNYIKLLSKN
jgi:hypothetical protein